MSAPDTSPRPGEARDHAILMAYDAFRICMGQKPQHASCETVMKWMALMSDKPLVTQINSGVTYLPHEFNPHKKYPWFCRDCGYPPHDEVKHIQHSDWSPAEFLNTCGSPSAQGEESR